MLFYLGPVSWGWSAHTPQASPVLQRLALEPEAGLVASRLQNLPAQIGLAPAYPSLGMTPPPPNYLLESSLSPPGRLSVEQHRWQRRFGVTHGVWPEGDDIQGTEVIAVMADPALERIFWDPTRAFQGNRWTVVRDLKGSTRGLGGPPCSRGSQLASPLLEPIRGGSTG